MTKEMYLYSSFSIIIWGRLYELDCKLGSALFPHLQAVEHKM